MNCLFSVNLYDRDGDLVDRGVFLHIGDSTIIKFQDSVELEQFGNRVLHMLKEIRETWKAAREAHGQMQAFRIIERMVDRLGYGRTLNNPPLTKPY